MTTSSSHNRDTNNNNTRSRPPASPHEDKTRGKTVILFFLLCIALINGLAAGSVWFITRMYQTLPTFEQLQNIEQSLVSKVLARDGSVIHEFSVERRFWVPLQKMPQELLNAVIAIEDRRFYRHWGIDIRRIAGAAIVDLIRGHFAQGASTITQQLARNVYLTAHQSLTRKIREALTAIQLESYYTKDEILELYLNQVYLGAGVYGVEAASQHYFSKEVSDLNLNECAVIAGIIQLPEHYRPDRERNLKRITQRRASVLKAMKDMGFIDNQTARTTMADTIPSNPPEQGARIAPYFIEMIRQEVSSRYGDDVLYNGGLTIHSTLDPVGQDSAETAARRHLASLQRNCNRIFVDSTKSHTQLRISRERFLADFDSIYNAHRTRFETYPDSFKLRIAQVSVVALDVESGAILAFVGGRDFTESKFNRAVQARRQPGSSFKPFVYTTAVDSGFTPATIVLDQPITLVTSEGEWRPENYDRAFSGPVTIRYALAKSINLVAIQVLNSVGADNVVACARRMGLQNRLNPVPSLAIGACEATPLEMTRAYGVFPNNGVMVKPYCISRIFDKNGRLLYDNKPEAEKALSPQTAFIMTDMLTDVVRRGTGATIPGLGFTRPSAGKTGTTNDYSDAWFVGFTPQIVCAVWVGVDERRSLGRGVTGSQGAIPVWVPTMIGLHASLPVKYFSRPDGIHTMSICTKSNKIALKQCPTTRDEYFTENSIIDSCDIHLPQRSRRSNSIHEMFGTTRKRTEPGGKPKRQLMF